MAYSLLLRLLEKVVLEEVLEKEEGKMTGVWFLYFSFCAAAMFLRHKPRAKKY